MKSSSLFFKNKFLLLTHLWNEDDVDFLPATGPHLEGHVKPCDELAQDCRMPSTALIIQRVRIPIAVLKQGTEQEAPQSSTARG